MCSKHISAFGERVAIASSHPKYKLNGLVFKELDVCLSGDQGKGAQYNKPAASNMQSRARVKPRHH